MQAKYLPWEDGIHPTQYLISVDTSRSPSLLTQSILQHIPLAAIVEYIMMGTVDLRDN